MAVWFCAGTQLVIKAISEMIKHGCQEVTLEAEVTNKGALKLYQNLGFIRDKRLHRWGLSFNAAREVLLRKFCC